MPEDPGGLVLKALLEGREQGWLDSGRALQSRTEAAGLHLLPSESDPGHLLYRRECAAL